MIHIRVVPLGKTIEAKEGESLFALFQKEGIILESYCGGMGSCGKCVVRILEGRASPPTSQEMWHLKERIGEGFRLSCQAVPLGDMVCDISTSLGSSVPLVVGAEGLSEEISWNDIPVKRRILQVKKPDLASVTSLKEQVQGEISVPFFEREALFGLSLLGEEDMAFFEVLWDDQAVFSIQAPPKEAFLGIAFDLGTTTVACELVDLSSGKILAREGALNGQARFGADVISRLRAIQDRFENLDILQKSTVGTMNKLIEAVCGRAHYDRDCVVSVTVSGNTIMEHLFLGLSPLSIGVTPYVPVFREGYVLRAEEVGLGVHPKARVYVFPSVAGYVGGDVVAGLGAFGIHRAEKVTLYVDIGTNGEAVLIHGGEAFACGTAAGPAFEGAGIRFGMRAVKGAIHAVQFGDREVSFATLENAPPQGICGTGLIDVLAGLLSVGLLSPAGRFRENREWSSFFEEEDGEKRFVVSKEPLIFLTQRDIEKLQLALAAVKAGREILLQEAGLREGDIEEVVLAGAFGSYIRPESAQAIGLVPQGVLTRSVGNASLRGARKALLSLSFRKEVERLARWVHYVELSARRDFEDAFCKALFFKS